MKIVVVSDNEDEIVDLVEITRFTGKETEFKISTVKSINFPRISEYGVEITDSNGNLKPISKIFQEVNECIKKYEKNHAKKTDTL